MRGTTLPKYTPWPHRRSLGGLGHVEQGDPSARAHDPAELGEEGAEVGEVAQREAGRGTVDGRRARAGAARRPGPAGASVRAWASMPHEKSTPIGRRPGAGQVAAQVARPAGDVEDADAGGRPRAATVRRRQPTSIRKVMTRLTRS